MNQGTTIAASASERSPHIEYVALPESELWWCNSHNRRATHMCHNSWNGSRVHCAPGQSGILLPCFCVELTGEVELEEC